MQETQLKKLVNEFEKIMGKSNNKYSMGHSDRGAVKLYRLSQYFYLHNWKYLSKLVKYFNTLIFKCFIPAEAKIGERLDLPHGGFGVVIHPNVEIGNDAIIFHNVTIGNGGARIGDRVTIGAGVSIIGTVNIGDDAVLGAGVVVTKDVPVGAVIVSAEPRVFLNKSINLKEDSY